MPKHILYTILKYGKKSRYGRGCASVPARSPVAHLSERNGASPTSPAILMNLHSRPIRPKGDECAQRQIGAIGHIAAAIGSTSDHQHERADATQ
jgi:hypothetical protein